jgi:hypothetical protein
LKERYDAQVKARNKINGEEEFILIKTLAKLLGKILVFNLIIINS